MAFGNPAIEAIFRFKFKTIFLGFNFHTLDNFKLFLYKHF